MSSESRAEEIVVRPRVVDVVLVLVLVAALLNALTGVLTLTGLEAALVSVRRTDPPPGQSAEVRDRLFAALAFTIAAISFAYAAVMIWLAFRFRGGARWGRTALVLLSPLSAVHLIAPSGPGISVVLLLLVAGVLMFRPSVEHWLRRLRNRGTP